MNYYSVNSWCVHLETSAVDVSPSLICVHSVLRISTWGQFFLNSMFFLPVGDVTRQCVEALFGKLKRAR